MSNHDPSRRSFLIRAAVGAGAVAGSGIVPDAYANAVGQQKQSLAPGNREQPATLQHGAFFNYEQAETVAALTERVMPGAPGKPGATDADVLNYIDLALAGAYAELQEFYRRGLSQLDAHCRKTYGKSFVQLTAAEQDEVLAALEQGKALEFSWPSAREFFTVIRTHTMEGMFADPIYGGNRDFTGWRLVGFPGAQGDFTPVDLRSRQAFTRAPIVGLQTKTSGPRE